ncbi:MAG: hypothetical protein ACJ0A9_01910 [Dehalococcoidia bacterium]
MKISRTICFVLMLATFIGCSFSTKTFFSLEKSIDSKPVEKSISENIFSSEEEALAKHLTKTGAVMYGVYWCPYCSQQKKIFGENFLYVKYIECDPRGENSNPKLCQYKGISKYPTWEIEGKMFEGVYTLKELQKISGFEVFRPSY